MALMAVQDLHVSFRKKISTLDNVHISSVGYGTVKNKTLAHSFVRRLFSVTDNAVCDR
jgi:hypothetical protein